MADQAPELTSIVIPTRNRPRALERCLQSLAALDTPRARFEVIFVDDGSESPAAPVVARFEGELMVSCVRQPSSRGPAAARNAGAERAQGSLLVFTDDDCTAMPGWIAALEKAADDAAADGWVLLGGRIENALPENRFSGASQQLISYLYAYGAETGPRFQFFCSNNLAIRPQAFRALGGFNAEFPSAAGEDRDLCDRFVAAGGRLVYEPGAVVRHAHRLDARGFVRQHFRYGRAACRFHRLRARRNGGAIRLEPVAFYLGMLRFPFARSDERHPWYQTLLLLVSQLANVAGFAAEALLGRAPRGPSGATAR